MHTNNPKNNFTSVKQQLENIGFCSDRGSEDDYSFSSSCCNASVSFPSFIREFTEAELSFIASLPYGKKTLGKSKTSMEYMKILICMIENSKKDSKGFVHIPVKYLGKIFKSVKTAVKILECSKKGLIQWNRFYDADLGISRGYKLTDGWKFQNHRLKLYKPSTEAKKALPETPVTEEAKAEKIIKKSLSPFIAKRLREKGIDPEGKKECSCCSRILSWNVL
jgi:hypothetical protein